MGSVSPSRDRLRFPLGAFFVAGCALGWFSWDRVGGAWLLGFSVLAIPVAALPQVFRGEFAWAPYRRFVDWAFRVLYVAPGYHDLQIVEESVSTAVVSSLVAWCAGLGIGGLLWVSGGIPGPWAG